eukprot:5497233-Ditylum_brightwellii.AAC.1
MVYYFGSEDFTDNIEDLFQSVNLQSLQDCLQEPSVSKHIAGMDLKKNTCGQPVLIDFNFSMQNCRDVDNTL